MLKYEKIMLVYQAGIANVFAVTAFNMQDYGRNAKRLLQSDFTTCYWFARGMGIAGCVVRSAHCNMAGDITNQHWDENLKSALFSPVDLKVN